MKKVKISELPLFNNLKGLFVIGTDNLNRSVKVSLEFVEEQTTQAVKNANTAASNALTAKEQTEEATRKADEATSKAKSATTNANNATKAATDAASAALTSKTAADEATRACKNATSATQTATEATLKATEESVTATENADTATANANTAASNALTAKATILDMMNRLIPTGLSVSCVERITITNKEPIFIKADLQPVDALKNIIFISDNNAVFVTADGRIWAQKEGFSRVCIIPTCNTSLAKTVLIEVGKPLARFVNTRGSLRLTSERFFRLT